MRILTCNVRNRSDGGDNTIPKRAQRLFRMIGELSPDIITLQECTPVWMLLIRLKLWRRYAIYNAYRGGDAESLCILWRRSIFRCVKKGKFMLSDNPDDMRSASYERRFKCRRITAYALLERKDIGDELLTADIHFGFDEPERVKSADLTASYLDRVSSAPKIVAGDMNCDSHSQAFAHMLRFYHSAAKGDDTPTFHGYDRGKPMRIDHVFASREVSVTDCRVVCEGEGCVSDHYAVTADFEIEK